jgi:eukaryotic-like serine/threonine-protein kinase
VLAGLFFLFSPGNNQLAVPDVSNQPQDVALRTLTGAGLKPNLVPVASDPSQVGKVLGTDPAAGTEVEPQTVIAMRVGRGPDRVQAPDLTGKTADQAQQIVQAAGLTLTPVPQQQPVDDSSQVGKVLSQTPTAGTLLSPGTAIQLTVGQQRQTIKVPDVTGQPVSTARSTLEGVGLEVTVSGDASGTATVASTSPAAGSTVAVGSTVTLTVTGGDRVSVPDITGKSVDDAKQTLANAGFTGNLQITSQNVDDPGEDGKVLSQTPSSGSQAGKADTIQVTVGRYTGGGGGGGGGGVFGGNGLFPSGN